MPPASQLVLISFSVLGLPVYVFFCCCCLSLINSKIQALILPIFHMHFKYPLENWTVFWMLAGIITFPKGLLPQGTHMGSVVVALSCFSLSIRLNTIRWCFVKRCSITCSLEVHNLSMRISVPYVHCGCCPSHFEACLCFPSSLVFFAG